jgi:hypothetical protein
MFLFFVAFGLFVHLVFWGAGLACLAMPRRWRAFWPVMAAPAGMALQSLTVWAGAYANLRGTDRYAWQSEAIPVVLLGLVLARRGVARMVAEGARFWAVGLLATVALGALVVPFQLSGRGLTTASLGSCDAADYAAGARVFKEFARFDRGGFLGLKEVTALMSADNFYDFWLRLNHFTPSALIALNGSVFDCAPFQLTSLLTAVLLAATVPVSFWMARGVMRYRTGPSLLVASFYGFNPLTWYAVYHVAMGQMVAALGIGLLTWAGVALWRGRFAGGASWTFTGILAIGYALVLGGYNFIVVVGLVPAAAFAGGLAIWEGEGPRFGRWALRMLVPLVLTGAIFWERVSGLVERFQLFRQNDFGWRIPLLGPEGWLGMVNGWALMRIPGPLHTVLAWAVLALVTGALIRGARAVRRDVFVALSLAVPVLLGYGYLNLRGIQDGTNASYDAYKILAVFYPGLLAALCYWVTLAGSRHRWQRILPWVAGVAIAGLCLRATFRFGERMSNPPLVVTKELIQVQKLETMPGVASLNMLVPDAWSRLWANCFLLHRPQYFLEHTYEGRRNTALRGSWDLDGGLVYVSLPDGESRRLNAHYSIGKTTSPYFLRARLEEGWHEQERVPHAATRWRWSMGDASLRLDNPHPRALRVVVRFDARSLVERDLQFWVNGRCIRTAHLNTALRTVRTPELLLPPGETVVRLRSDRPPTRLSEGDTRSLGFAAYDVEIEVRPEAEEPAI